MNSRDSNDPPRELRADERAVLRKLLSVNVQGVKGLRQQIPHTRVREECSCGCPSVWFVVERRAAPRADVDDNARIEGIARPGKKTAISVMLFFLDGYLDELEVLGYGAKKARRLPAVEELKVYVVI